MLLSKVITLINLEIFILAGVIVVYGKSSVILLLTLVVLCSCMRSTVNCTFKATKGICLCVKVFSAINFKLVTV